MEIEEKYIKVLGKYVYNKELDKFGHIASLELTSGFGMWIQYRVFYDTFDSNHLLFFNDFLEGKVKFTIITNVENPDYKEFECKELEDIKSAFGDKYSDDMIMYISDNERKEKNQGNDKRNVQRLYADLISLTDISAEVLSKDFYSRELYLKWKDGVLNEKELLYALVNHISQEYRRIDDRNLEYFFKYEFPRSIKNSNCEY